MSTRKCPRCGAEVSATAERCPRGHVLPPDVGGDLQDLRAEVDQAFELARKKVATALSDLGTPAQESDEAAKETKPPAEKRAAAPATSAEKGPAPERAQPAVREPAAQP
ncbi:MAG: hypothetical protein M3271_03625, partial [Actinomycetota bacterium]|nr:hypothetical protein [Actinomycetota bacterium]